MSTKRTALTVAHGDGIGREIMEALLRGNSGGAEADYSLGQGQ